MAVKKINPIKGKVSLTSKAGVSKQKNMQSVNSDQSISDGEIAMLLRPLRGHVFLKAEEIEDIVSRKVELERDIVLLCECLEGKGLIEKNKAGFSLTIAGESWLDERDAEFSVEEEDLSSDGKPQKPYEVAKLKMETKHLSVFQALRKIEKGEINLNPEFQRAFVWDIVKQSRLIESVLIRIPLPAFYLDATDQVYWSVVDGLQRLTTLNRYCREKSFKLQGLQFLTELENYEFDDLPARYKVLIEDDTPLLFYNLMPGTPVEAKFTIFSRVNTGGMQLTPQEIRHALNQGKITEQLKKTAQNATFRAVTKGVVESLRMSDRELILRSFAFMYLGVKPYRQFNEMDSFLLHAMSQMNGLSEAELEKLEKKFVASIKKVLKIFGRYAFRKFTKRNGRRSPFNKALFEVWTVAVSKYPDATLSANKEKIIDAFMGLVGQSESFVRSISSSTGSHSAVAMRFSKIEEILQAACND